jgi:dolichol-phosphate mannosyltransferase
MPSLVIIPTYNERDNLPVLVRQIMAYPDLHVMVADDNSPDGTGQIADGLAREFEGRVAVLHRTGPRGLGRSYLDAISRAVHGDWTAICQMDADLSHDPQYLPAMLAAVADHDLAIGSRYLEGVSVVNWPLRRIILSAFANRYIRLVTRLRVNDCTSGYRCWRREALARLPLDRIVSEGYAFLVEMLYDAMQTGCRITEVPIVFVERRLGTSKLSGSVLLESLLMPWRLVLGSGRRGARRTAGAPGGRQDGTRP